MSHDFTLSICPSLVPGSSPAQAQLRLLDAHENHLASNYVDFGLFTVSERHALYDLGHYLSAYHNEQKETEVIAATGVLIAEKVLGEAIFKLLYASQAKRTLRILLHGPMGDQKSDTFRTALARIPWEIARPTATKRSLSERALQLIISHEMAQPASHALPLPTAADEMLRVLFIFAHTQGATPLGMRQERRALQDLFQQKIYPNRKIEAHFLAHGVTRAQLEAQIREHGGYHIVHWRGHGHHNLLQLAKPGGTPDHLSGEELLALFYQAGGTLPRLCFLSAGNSGHSVAVENWHDFLHGENEPNPANPANPANVSKEITNGIDLPMPPAFIGTAQALLDGGVPSVVAMRYEVSGDYARELALVFYQALLGDPNPKSVAVALAQAREQVRRAGVARYNPLDHATPLLLGTDQIGLAGKPGRSHMGKTMRRSLPGLGEFTVQNNFVGRTWELDSLGSEFINLDGSKAVAQITGLGGMGKTALAAEVIDVWKTRFNWVLLFQAKPNELRLESFLNDLHLHLAGELGEYHQHVNEHPADAIYRPSSDFPDQKNRQKRLAENLLLAMENDAILLVLDNFEVNLKRQAEPGGKVWAAKDPAWDEFLRQLSQGLAQNTTRSRLLITCRRPLAALLEQPYHWLQLGPLPAAEARLYLLQHPDLSRMLYGTDEAEQILAQRLLQASRFHPLLMDRLARLCASPAHRQTLLQALQTLEHSHDYAQLPQLFSSHPASLSRSSNQASQSNTAQELAYLQDALEQSIDELIRHAGDDAAKVLWRVALANEAITLGLLETVWRGISPKLARLYEVKTMLANIDQQPPEIAEQLQALPPDVLELLASLPDEAPDAKPSQPLTALLAMLVSVGLLDEHRDGPEDTNPEYTCHEMVRERSTSWAAQQADQTDKDPKPIWLAYAKRLSATFKALQARNISAAMQAGTRAVVYCVQAQAYEQLGEFASSVVTSTNDVRLLQGLIPHLQAAANAAPEGKARWSCLCYLADALRKGGQIETSLAFYQDAASLAHHHAQTNSSAAAWSDFAWISGNWTIALLNCGQLSEARQRLQDSAGAERRAGSPALNIILNELEALRIAIMQGELETALPEIETRLAQVTSWWQQHKAGKTVPEAPDAVMLARTFISALDIAKDAAYALKDWPAALPHIETMLEVQAALHASKQNMATIRMNHANVLAKLQRFDEAKTELEACLGVFQSDPASSACVLSSLASLFADQGDLPQATAQERRALALRANLPNPQERAISHNNLANYLEKSQQTGVGIKQNPSQNLNPQINPAAESRHHQLAALIYHLCAGLQQSLQTSRRNYTIDFRQARTSNSTLSIPRISELLAEPGFYSLNTWLSAWLAQNQTDLPQLQATVDAWLEAVKTQALAQE